MDKILTQLEAIGLSAKEALTYLSLLELGQATAYTIAQKSGLKRPTTYIVLDELRKKGLLLKVPKVKKQLFIAKSPQEFLTEQEEKIKEAKQILPELLAKIYKNNKARTLYFEDKEGLIQAFNYKFDKLAKSELLVFYAKSKSENEQIFKPYRDYALRLAKQNTHIRGFAPKHLSLEQFRKEDKEHNRNIVQLSTNEYSSDVSLEIADDFIRIFLHRDKQVVIIDSKDFAHTMREIFEIVWQSKLKLK